MVSKEPLLIISLVFKGCNGIHVPAQRFYTIVDVPIVAADGNLAIWVQYVLFIDAIQSSKLWAGLHKIQYDVMHLLPVIAYRLPETQTTEDLQFLKSW